MNQSYGAPRPNSAELERSELLARANQARAEVDALRRRWGKAARVGGYVTAFAVAAMIWGWSSGGLMRAPTTVLFWILIGTVAWMLAEVVNAAVVAIGHRATAPTRQIAAEAESMVYAIDVTRHRMSSHGDWLTPDDRHTSA